MTNLYLDAEWYLNQRIFLLGYAYENLRGKIAVHQEYHTDITTDKISQIFQPCTGYVFVYGPDIGMLEKRFNPGIRNRFTCVNLLKVVKEFLPGLSSYKLADIEKHFGFYRKADKYKKNIFDIYKDWNHPEMKKIVLDYNYEDVFYLAKIKQKLFRKFKPSDAYLQSIALAAKSIGAIVLMIGAYVFFILSESHW